MAGTHIIVHAHILHYCVDIFNTSVYPLDVRFVGPNLEGVTDHRNAVRTEVIVSNSILPPRRSSHKKLLLQAHSA
jgi:hypothetical protein